MPSRGITVQRAHSGMPNGSFDFWSHGLPRTWASSISDSEVLWPFGCSIGRSEHDCWQIGI